MLDVECSMFDVQKVNNHCSVAAHKGTRRADARNPSVWVWEYVSFHPRTHAPTHSQTITPPMSCLFRQNGGIKALTPPAPPVPLIIFLSSTRAFRSRQARWAAADNPRHPRSPADIRLLSAMFSCQPPHRRYRLRQPVFAPPPVLCPMRPRLRRTEPQCNPRKPKSDRHRPGSGLAFQCRSGTATPRATV